MKGFPKHSHCVDAKEPTNDGVTIGVSSSKERPHLLHVT